MVILSRKRLLFIILLFSFFSTSCAKLDYLFEQGYGQLALLSSGKDNDEVLKSVRVPRDQKSKIRRIQQLKKYFYKYWGKRETQIYSKTTMLRQNAVTYLVVSSPWNEIKAEETCFPLMGCFPYLGFFNQKSARAFAKEKEQDGMATWIRPVYAYSTLGYFTDNILSSFFYYSDYDLTELIFHELFHTIFFAKNEVELNENLANYFAKEMLQDYFKYAHEDNYILIKEKEDFEEKELTKLVVSMTNELQTYYSQKKPKSRTEAQDILKSFLENRFFPTIMSKCESLNIQRKNCFPLDREWNNASFAAFLTYEKKSQDLKELQTRLGVDLKGLYKYIDEKYKAFRKQKKIESFSTFLFM